MRGATKFQALTPDYVDRAFALAREANSALSLEEWRRFANPRSSDKPTQLRSPGVLIVLRENTIRGIAAVEQAITSDGGRALYVTRVVIMDRIRRDRVAREMLQGLFRMAHRDGCIRIRVNLPQSSAWLIKYWSDPDGAVLRLPVECKLAAETEFAEPQTDNVVHVQFSKR